MSRGFARTAGIGLLALIVIAFSTVALGQEKTFIPVEGATLESKIDAAIVAGKANSVNGRFWVAYRFEVRPGVAVDFEIVDNSGDVYLTCGYRTSKTSRDRDRSRPERRAIPILIRTARNHPRMPVRKVAIQMLGQTGDERAVAFFRELLSKD